MLRALILQLNREQQAAADVKQTDGGLTFPTQSTAGSVSDVMGKGVLPPPVCLQSAAS